MFRLRAGSRSRPGGDGPLGGPRRDSRLQRKSLVTELMSGAGSCCESSPQTPGPQPGAAAAQRLPARDWDDFQSIIFFTPAGPAPPAPKRLLFLGGVDAAAHPPPRCAPPDVREGASAGSPNSATEGSQAAFAGAESLWYSIARHLFVQIDESICTGVCLRFLRRTLVTDYLQCSSACHYL